jgi:hypothetical protein
MTLIFDPASGSSSDREEEEKGPKVRKFLLNYLEMAFYSLIKSFLGSCSSKAPTVSVRKHICDTDHMFFLISRLPSLLLQRSALQIFSIEVSLASQCFSWAREVEDLALACSHSLL